jgi:hypothetical protein
MGLLHAYLLLAAVLFAVQAVRSNRNYRGGQDSLALTIAESLYIAFLWPLYYAGKAVFWTLDAGYPMSGPFRKLRAYMTALKLLIRAMEGSQAEVEHDSSLDTLTATLAARTREQIGGRPRMTLSVTVVLPVAHAARTMPFTEPLDDPA